MKQGNQFYLELQILDEKDELLNISSVNKIQFNIGEFTKIYGENKDEVTYDYENNVFKIWFTEEETFKMVGTVKIDVRILFKNDVILGSKIESIYFYESLKKAEIDV